METSVEGKNQEPTKAKEDAYYQAKARVQIYQEQAFPRFISLFICAILIFYLFYILCYFLPVSQPLTTFPKWLVISLLIVCSLLVSFGFFWWKKKPINQDYQIIHEYELKYPQKELTPEFIEASDQYTALMLEEAKKGLLMVRVALWAGLIIIIFGLVALLMKQTTPACITCASGSIVELFSLLLRSRYQTDIEQMKYLHSRRSYAQKIYLALHIANSLPEDKQPEAKMMILKELLKDINAPMRKSDADTDEPPKKDKPADAETQS